MLIDVNIAELSVLNDDGVVWIYKDRLCVPNDQALREKVMTKLNSLSITIHPGSTKMYRDLKQYFWWNEARSVGDSYVKGNEISMDFVYSGLPILRFPFRGSQSFGIKGKLRSRFIGPFEIFERIGEVSYRLRSSVVIANLAWICLLSERKPESILDRQEKVMEKQSYFLL
ncbi:retrotransposon protein, putative, ty3-gypsy subclass [Tanacetum coccineum]